MSNAEELITDEARQWIGMEFEMHSDPISLTQIKEYVSASDDYNPIYVDEEAARAAGYSTVAVPPLAFMHTIRPRARQSGLTADGSTADRRPPIGQGRGVAGELEFEFFRMLQVGDTLTGKRRLASLTPKDGATKSFVICTWETEYFDQNGELVIRERNSQILY